MRIGRLALPDVSSIRYRYGTCGPTRWLVRRAERSGTSTGTENHKYPLKIREDEVSIITAMIDSRHRRSTSASKIMDESEQ